MEKRGKWLLVGSAVAAAGLAAAQVMHSLTANRMASIAFDRDCPRLPMAADREKLKGSRENEGFLTVLSGYAAALRDKPARIITLKARDGTELVGHWIPAENPKRVILAMHGWRSSWDRDFGMASDFFSQQACSVLYAEQRGQNGSQGNYIGFGVLERYDCLDWLSWIQEESGGSLPVYLVGVSMGATTVMLAGGLELPESVRGIIADCGFTSIQDISHHVLRHNLGFRISDRSIDRRCRKRLQVGASSCSTVQVLQNCRLPLLLIHGDADSFVPVSMSHENFSAAAGPKELLVVHGADHGMSYYLEPKRYERTVLDFWSKYDD